MWPIMFVREKKGLVVVVVLVVMERCFLEQCIQALVLLDQAPTDDEQLA